MHRYNPTDSPLCILTLQFFHGPYNSKFCTPLSIVDILFVLHLYHTLFVISKPPSLHIVWFCVWRHQTYIDPYLFIFRPGRTAATVVSSEQCPWRHRRAIRHCLSRALHLEFFFHLFIAAYLAPSARAMTTNASLQSNRMQANARRDVAFAFRPKRSQKFL